MNKHTYEASTGTSKNQQAMTLALIKVSVCIQNEEPARKIGNVKGDAWYSDHRCQESLETKTATTAALPHKNETASWAKIGKDNFLKSANANMYAFFNL